MLASRVFLLLFWFFSAIWKPVVGFTSSGSQGAVFPWCSLSTATLSGVFLTLF